MIALFLSTTLLIQIIKIPDPLPSICMTEALFYEARGEGEIGQYAVAEVIMNRVHSKSFPNSICSVVHQPSRNPRRPKACAFSYSCDKKPRRIYRNEIYLWRKAYNIGSQFLDGERPSNYTDGALHFLRCDIRHSVAWAKHLPLKFKVNKHCFLE